MNFISRFSKVEGFGSVLVVVYRFSKYAIFIPAPNLYEAGHIFFNNVVKHFRMLDDIVSDQDTWFTSRFWVVLFMMWGIECRFSTANHPQTDSQIERLNQMLEEYLRHYVIVAQTNWLELLKPAQLSYNLQ